MIQPIKHRVLIQRDEPIKEVGSIVLHESAQERPTRGTVLAVGGSAEELIKIGQTVLFGKHDGFDVAPEYCDGKERCLLIADNQIKAILEDINA